MSFYHLNVFQMLSDWAGDVVNVEELTVFGRPWQYRGEGNANIVIALQDVSYRRRFAKIFEKFPKFARFCTTLVENDSIYFANLPSNWACFHFARLFRKIISQTYPRY